MPTLGKILYNFYIAACAKRDCLVDPWETLSKNDKDDWEWTAGLYGDWIRS